METLPLDVGEGEVGGGYSAKSEDCNAAVVAAPTAAVVVIGAGAEG